MVDGRLNCIMTIFHTFKFTFCAHCDPQRSELSSTLPNPSPSLYRLMTYFLHYLYNKRSLIRLRRTNFESEF